MQLFVTRPRHSFKKLMFIFFVPFGRKREKLILTRPAKGEVVLNGTSLAEKNIIKYKINWYMQCNKFPNITIRQWGGGPDNMAKSPSLNLGEECVNLYLTYR